MEKETKWTIDPVHSEIGFRVKHLMITHVKGTFKKFDADISTQGEDFTTARIHVWIDPGSINTGDDKRDEHLKSSEFFNVEKNKDMTFNSAGLEKNANGKWELHGELTMNGVSKEIKLDVEYGGKMKDPWGAEKAGFTITGKINRKDWKIAWNAPLEAGGVLLSDEVAINCEVQLVKKVGQELKAESESSKNEELIV